MEQKKEKTTLLLKLRCAKQGLVTIFVKIQPYDLFCGSVRSGVIQCLVMVRIVSYFWKQKKPNQPMIFFL